MTQQLAREIIEFVLWLTPCGECEPGPTIKTIGREARKVYRKIQISESKFKRRCRR